MSARCAICRRRIRLLKLRRLFLPVVTFADGYRAPAHKTCT